MLTRPLDNKVAERFPRWSDARADTGIARVQCVVLETRPVPTHCFIKPVGATGVNVVVDFTDMLYIRAKTGLAADINGNMDTQKLCRRRGID